MTKEMTEENKNDLNKNDNIVRIAYDPTFDNMPEIVLVGGTDESYKSLETFEKAWNHPNDHLRNKWREAI